MPYDFSDLNKKLTEAQNRLQRELNGIRAGRASPALLDKVSVEAYGARMSVGNLCGITVDDPRTLRISPWDASLIKAVEKGIAKASLGVSVVVDERCLRVIFPQLTGERRNEFIKTAKEKLEQAKISVRKARDEEWSRIQSAAREGAIGEDDKFRIKDEMEKTVRVSAERLEKMYGKKEKEILEV